MNLTQLRGHRPVKWRIRVSLDTSGRGAIIMVTIIKRQTTMWKKYQIRQLKIWRKNLIYFYLFRHKTRKKWGRYDLATHPTRFQVSYLGQRHISFIRLCQLNIYFCALSFLSFIEIRLFTVAAETECMQGKQAKARSVLIQW